ncbi:MAG: hypothetical protein K5886_00090 [Lachnospiraceae bacterium]|nr:hypothetical protein [Lachnospiraceae bacterium]
MKTVFALSVTIAVILLLLIKKEYRIRIITGYTGILILFNLAYDILLIKNTVPFYRPFSQTYYQKEFAQGGEYPDSLLPLILKGKKIYVKDDPYTIEEAKAEGKDYLYAYYHGVNLVNFAKFSGAEVIKDETMNDSAIPGSLRESDFECLGMANDMFRYTFLMNDFWEELGNYFTYQWYYYDHLDPIFAYANILPDKGGKDVYTSDELVILWDSSHEREEEDIYLMTKEYYDDRIRKDPESISSKR